MHSRQQKRNTSLSPGIQSPISTYGEQSLTLGLGLRHTFQWVFVIARLPTPILGADFLYHFGLFEDIKHGRLVDSSTQLTVHGLTARVATDSSIVLQTTSHSTLLTEYPDVARPVFYNQLIKHEVTRHIKTRGPSVVA